tara:strand:+ start:3644 stop:4834 length:1191 start_codon:yes stop_codon:yes gene_type:complete
MLFQTFDDKEHCSVIYANHRLYLKARPEKMTKTWSYSESLKDENDVEYAQIYCGGKTLDEICPQHHVKEWEAIKDRLTAFYRACGEAKLDLNDHCFYDMVPKFFLKDLAQIKNKICDFVFCNYEKSKNYDLMFHLIKILTEIKNTKLNVDYSALKNRRHEFKVRKFISNNKNNLPYVNYDPFKTKTGRLATKPNSFPILTMDKTYRKILKPNNGWFLEFDFNAAELRVLLGLTGKEQPQEDIHEWNAKNIYHGLTTREEAKKRIFAWLYNPKSEDSLSNKAYDKASLLKKYWDGSCVNTMYNRKIEADEYHALNYLIQSTAADLFFKQLINIRTLLEGRKSKVAFCMHDSIIIDYAEEDNDILLKLKRAFSNTDLGNFMVNTSVGKNYGEMKKLSI